MPIAGSIAHRKTSRSIEPAPMRPSPQRSRIACAERVKRFLGPTPSSARIGSTKKVAIAQAAPASDGDDRRNETADALSRQQPLDDLQQQADRQLHRAPTARSRRVWTRTAAKPSPSVA